VAVVLFILITVAILYLLQSPQQVVAVVETFKIIRHPYLVKLAVQVVEV
jgi:hypothetical protein